MSIIDQTAGQKAEFLAAGIASGLASSITTTSQVGSKSALVAAPVGSPTILSLKGGEGTFYARSKASDPTLAAKIAADPLQAMYAQSAIDADKVWVRNARFGVLPEWFGAKGDDISDDGPAFKAALALLRASVVANGDAYGYGKGSQKLFIPSAAYFLGANTLDIAHMLIFEGENGAGASGGGTILRWGPNVTGLRTQRSDTAGATGIGTSPPGAAGTIIRNLVLTGAYQIGQESESHGLHIRCPTYWDALYIRNWAGDGIFMDAQVGGVVNRGNVNGSGSGRTFIDGCRNGIYQRGSDANALEHANTQCFSNRRYGIWLDNTLGSTFLGGDLSTNGDCNEFPTQCIFNGQWYFLLPKGNGAVQPNGAAQNDANWYWTGSDPDPNYHPPARTFWSASTAYRSGGAMRQDGLSGYTSISGMYREGDQMPPAFEGPVLYTGGLFGAIDFAGNVYGGGISGDSNAVSFPKDVVANKSVIGRGSAHFFGPLPGNPPVNTTLTISSTQNFQALEFRNYRGGQNKRSATLYGQDDDFHINSGTDGLSFEVDYALVARVVSSGINLAAGKTYQVGGKKVVGDQQPAIADTSGATLAALETEVNKLKAMVRTHGLIAS